jgi:signal transduction histidine kinase
MMDRDNAEPFAQTGMLIAMAVVVLSSVGWSVLWAPTWRAVPLAALGAVYLLLSTAGWVACEARGPRAMSALLIVLTVVTYAALWISRMSVSLIVMPVLLLITLYAGRGWAIALTIATAGFAALLAISEGLRPIEVYARATDFVPGAVVTIVFSEVLMRERRARHAARRAAAQVEELAVTRERNRIARDIHDSVGHYLTVVHVQIEAARAIAAAEPARADECLVRAKELAREGLTELRRSVSMLRGGAVGERPFGVALSSLVDECKDGGLDATLAIEGTPRPLPPAIEFALFRVAQEALTNVKRHAQAHHVRCALRYDPDQVQVRIEDDGVGAASPADGFGLVGVRERVQAVGGTVAVRTAAGQGFAIDVRVPT